MNGGRTATAASAGQPMHQPARDKFKKVLLLLRVLENSESERGRKGQKARERVFLIITQRYTRADIEL
jgi:hypothetical protein